MLSRMVRIRAHMLRRTYVTASGSTKPIRSQTPSTAEQFPPSMMQRTRNRPLPTLAALNPNRRWLRSFPIFVAILVVSALGIFNYQKVNSPVVTATLYSLRTNPRVRALLGDEVYFGSKWAWIHGQINLVQGKIDVWFSVKGTRQSGICRFKAHRYGGKGGSWKTTEWSLTPEGNAETMQLLDDMDDPLAGAAF